MYLYSTSAELTGVQNGRNSQKGWALISASGSALYLNSSIPSLMMTTELGELGVFQLFLPCWCRYEVERAKRRRRGEYIRHKQKNTELWYVGFASVPNTQNLTQCVYNWSRILQVINSSCMMCKVFEIGVV